MVLKQQRVVTSLDVGSNKIVCLIGYLNSLGNIVIKGVGHQQSRGIFCGNVINKKELERCIFSAVKIAEKNAGCEIGRAVLNLNALTTSSITRTTFQLKGKKVKHEDMEVLARDICNILGKDGRKVIHLMPLQYLLDGSSVETPFDVPTNDLEVTFHLIDIERDVLSRFKACVESAMLDVDGCISNGYASSFSILRKTERELGVMVLDIGYSNTNISVVCDNKYIFEGNIGIGGESITKDIAIVLKTTQAIAEKVKIINANFTLSKDEEENLIRIDIGTNGDFDVSSQKIGLINDIAKARIEEIVKLSIKKLTENSLLNVPKTVVLVGGTSLIPGIDGLVSNISHLDTRIGYNENVNAQDRDLLTKLRSPIYSAAVGMLDFMQNRYENNETQAKHNISFFGMLRKIFG